MRTELRNFQSLTPGRGSHTLGNWRGTTSRSNTSGRTTSPHLKRLLCTKWRSSTGYCRFCSFCHEHPLLKSNASTCTFDIPSCHSFGRTLTRSLYFALCRSCILGIFGSHIAPNTQLQMQRLAYRHIAAVVTAVDGIKRHAHDIASKLVADRQSVQREVSHSL